jgi:RNA polymerase sigma-70 factor (ECF subfamily)
MAGEDAAYRECYELHAPALMRVLVRVLRNRALAEEILQESFVAAFRKIGQFRGETKLSSWLTGIALRRGLNALRGESRRLKHLPPPPEPETSFEPFLADRDMTRKVLALLDEMEPEKRMALLLQAEGHTAAEIAEMMGEPRGTVLSRLARSRAELVERAAAAGLVEAGEWLKKEGGA